MNTFYNKFASVAESIATLIILYLHHLRQHFFRTTFGQRCIQLDGWQLKTNISLQVKFLRIIVFVWWLLKTHLSVRFP